MKRIISIAAAFFFVLLFSCTNQNKPSTKPAETLSGKLIIFHAGSLSVPVKMICDSFKEKHPQVEILTEACGSKQCARNITDLHKDCDIFISADYKVIDEMLIPQYAIWDIPFASNEMTIVYNQNSKYADEINKDNWYDVLMKKDVAYGRSDPNSDPCGVRAVLCSKLAEKYYNKKGLVKQLLTKDNKYIRPKETDLLALLETNAVDYIFLYKSVAMQHKLKYIVLPDEINLKKQELSDLYKTVSVEVCSSKPGEKTIETGEPMIYGITILSGAQNKNTANAFMDYFLTAGQKIMEANGQPSVIPSVTKTYDHVPEAWKKFVLKPKPDEIQ